MARSRYFLIGSFAAAGAACSSGAGSLGLTPDGANDGGPGAESDSASSDSGPFDGDSGNKKDAAGKDGGDAETGDPAPLTLSKIATGYSFACGVRASGTVACWGIDTMHQLGRDNSGSNDSTVPDDVARVTGAVAVAADNCACALLATGRVMCWGPGFVGEPWPGAPPGTDLLAQYIPDVIDAVSVFVGRYSACAIRANGDVTCRYGTRNVDYVGAKAVQGWDEFIVSTDGSISHLSGSADGGAAGARVSVSGPGDAVAIGGSYGTGPCILRKGGGIECRNRASTIFSPVAGTSDALTLTIGLNNDTSDAVCAIRINGTLRCWDSSGAKKDFAGLANLEHASLGKTSGCARTTSGTVHCWGDNSYGQLGNGTTTPTGSVVPVTGL